MPVLYTITSSLHQEVSSDVLHEPFIRDICDALGEEMIFKGSDFSDFGVHPIELIYIRTGGTEGIFKSLGLKGHIRLLTSGKSNSLAASMEILSYLRSQGRTGEILHGDPDYIASRIREGGEEKNTCHSKFLRPLPPSDSAENVPVS